MLGLKMMACSGHTTRGSHPSPWQEERRGPHMIIGVGGRSVHNRYRRLLFPATEQQNADQNNHHLQSIIQQSDGPVLHHVAQRSSYVLYPSCRWMCSMRTRLPSHPHMPDQTSCAPTTRQPEACLSAVTSRPRWSVSAV